MVSIARRNPKHTKDENKTFARRTRNECKKKRKTGYTCKSANSAIPSGISRNRRMVALSRHIAGGRLRRFYIHSHIHRYPRAAKALRAIETSFYCTNCIYCI